MFIKYNHKPTMVWLAQETECNFFFHSSPLHELEFQNYPVGWKTAIEGTTFMMRGFFSFAVL